MLICCVSSPKSYIIAIVHLNVLKRKFSKNNVLHLDFTANNFHSDSNSNRKVRRSNFQSSRSPSKFNTE